MIILDFDKTISAQDTLFGFYKMVQNDSKARTNFKFILYYLFMILHKMRLISNDKLKELGIRLFLKDKTIDEIRIISREYADQINYNVGFERHLWDFAGRNDVYVITASFEDYVKLALRKFNWTVYGSRLKVNSDGLVSGLERNLYGKNKLKFLIEVIGKESIESVYTDSMSDKPLIDFAKNAFMVSKDSVVKIK